MSFLTRYVSLWLACFGKNHFNPSADLQLEPAPGAEQPCTDKGDGKHAATSVVDSKPALLETAGAEPADEDDKENDITVRFNALHKAVSDQTILNYRGQGNFGTCAPDWSAQLSWRHCDTISKTCA